MSDLEDHRWLMAQRLKSREVPAGDRLKVADLAYSSMRVDIDGMRGFVWIDPDAGNFSWWSPLIRCGVLTRTGIWRDGCAEYVLDVRAIPARTGVMERPA